MMTIKPQTYNEILRMKNCMDLKQYVPGISDAQLERIYLFLGEDKKNSVTISGGAVSFLAGKKVKDYMAVSTRTMPGKNYSRIAMKGITSVIRSPVDNNSGSDRTFRESLNKSRCADAAANFLSDDTN